MSLPEEVLDEAVRLTRLARRAVDEREARAHRERRDRLLDGYGYVARVRVESGDLGRAARSPPVTEAEESVTPGEPPAASNGEAGTGTQGQGRRGRREVLVCYPSEWIIDGTVDPERVEDTSRAVERRLTGPGEDDEWEDVEAHNRAVADTIAAEYGPVHGANAHAFADFMGNHYARRVETATDAEVAEFLEEYFPRNAWPTDDQRAVVDRSIDLIRDR